VDILTCQ